LLGETIPEELVQGDRRSVAEDSDLKVR
jgi:hypothetical protein